MPRELLQILGGVPALLNKICFSRAERCNDDNKERKFRIWAWITHLVSFPPWAIIFVIERNWMGTALNLGAIPAMTLGLVIAIRGLERQPRWLDYITLTAVIIGLGYSLYDFGGMTQLTQVAELGIVVGFFIGTYMLAKKKPTGYLWYILMNGSTAWLMAMQGYPWLFAQQVASVGFIVDAFVVQRSRQVMSSV